jgi:hypothetical protein
MNWAVQVFKKETDEEKRARELKQKAKTERRAEQREADHVLKARDRVMAADEKREAAAGRKRKEREHRYAADVEAGIRNGDFTLAVKKRLIVHHLFGVEYQLISSRLHPRCAMNPVPTISRSCHVRRVRSKTDIKKNIELTAPAGRKSVNRLSVSTRTGSLHSCLTRFSRQGYVPNIPRKACIVKDLQARDRETFANLKPTTVQAWFDRDSLGGLIWKKSAVKLNGNTPGHEKGGQKGALVSK